MCKPDPAGKSTGSFNGETCDEASWGLARCGIGKSAHTKSSVGTECIYVHEIIGAGQPEFQCEEALLQEVQPTIRGIVQRKLRVSLHPADRQQRNQDALELVGDIQVALLEKLRQM
jgi:hypothetical protein